MKSLGEVLQGSIQYLKDKQVSNPRLVAETILSHLLHLSRMDLYMSFDCPLKEEELSQIRALLKRAILQEPVEYMTGFVDFYGISLSISPHVLIPRPETEILVDMAARLMEKAGIQEKVLFDICTGSGCIGLSLKKKFPALSVTLSDLSKDSLAICQKAALDHNLDVTILQGDLLEPFQGKKADYVFCNPPYISEEEYEGLQPSVKKYEPKMALVGGVTGLEFYERLAATLPSFLNPKAQVFLEIGQGQGESVNKIFSDACWVKRELIQDWSSKDRFFFLEIE